MSHKSCFLGFLILSLSGFAGCTQGPPPVIDGSSINLDEAKSVANTVAADLIADNAKDLFLHLDEGFLTVVSNDKDLEKVMQKLYADYGRPTSCEPKTYGNGVRVDGIHKRPKKIITYAITTTKLSKGYYLKVEVAPALNGVHLVVTGFGIFDLRNKKSPFLQ